MTTESEHTGSHQFYLEGLCHATLPKHFMHSAFGMHHTTSQPVMELLIPSSRASPNKMPAWQAPKQALGCSVRGSAGRAPFCYQVLALLFKQRSDALYISPTRRTSKRHVKGT